MNARNKTWGERLDLTGDTVGPAVLLLSWIAVILTAVWAVTYCWVNHISVSDIGQTIRHFVDDGQGDEVGFVKAVRAEGYTESANDALDAGHKICGRLRSDGSTPTDVVNWMESNRRAGLDAAMVRKMSFALVTNAQMYLCPDTLHNTGTPTPTTVTVTSTAPVPTATRAPTAPPTMVATTAPTTTPPFHAATSDVSAVGTGGTRQLIAVRLARNNGYDRLVLEFADGVPGYTVGYRPLPAHADGSGDEIPLPGARAFVQVVLTGATGSGWSGGARTYFGPSTVSADTEAVTEAKAAGDYEAVLTWVVGLRAKVPFRVFVLDGPPRLVVDFQH